MSHRHSVMIVTPDAWLAERIAGSIDTTTGIRVQSQASTLGGMNGQAVEIARSFDIILFQTSPETADDIRALEALGPARRPGTRLVALADGSLSLAEARALERAGADEVMPLPFEVESIGAHVAGLLRTGSLTLQAPARGRRGQVIAVAQARGGVGSTTVAVNLADMLAGGGARRKAKEAPRVALVDFDLQFGTVGSYLDLNDQDSLLQIAQDGTIPDATFLDQAMARTANGLSVLTAPAKFAPIDSLSTAQVEAIIDELRSTHDHVVIDLPRALVGWVEPIIHATDLLLLVTDISVSSIRHCRRLAEFFTTNNVALSVEVVVNRQRKPIFRSSMQREAARALGRPLDVWLPADRAAQAAADRGQPLSRTAPRSGLAKACARLAQRTVRRAASAQIQPVK